MKQLRALLIIFLGFSLFLAVTAPPGRAVESVKAVLRVEGMYCASCPLTVKITLQKLDGVSAAEVTRKPEGRAEVTYDPEKVTVAQMVAAVEKAGYKAYPVRDRMP